jgi:hypothetical protein
VAGKSRQQFRFDASAHAYFVGARRLPSITQILRATHPDGATAGWWSEESALRGTRIHEATARFDLSGAWGDDLLVDDVSRVRAYAAFLASRQPLYDEVEQPRWSRRYGFAGTPDRVGRWRDGRAFVLDLKTGVTHRDHGLQTAAQALLVDGVASARLRYTLYLRDDGSYRLVAWPDASDYLAFLDRLLLFTTSHGGDL